MRIFQSAILYSLKGIPKAEFLEQCCYYYVEHVTSQDYQLLGNSTPSDVYVRYMCLHSNLQIQ